MSVIFGWCQGSGHHDSCRKETGTTTGILRCGCQCHDGDSPSREGESGSAKRRESGTSREIMETQINEPPATYFEVRGQGLSPTLGVD